MEHLEKMRSREKVLQEKLLKSEDIRSSESQLRRTFNEIKSENESLKQELLNLEVEASQKEERHKIQVTCCVCFPSRSLGMCQHNVGNIRKFIKSSYPMLAYLPLNLDQDSETLFDDKIYLILVERGGCHFTCNSLII